VPEQIAATSVSIPAPVGGWNTRDPLDDMPAQDAIRLINLIPGTSSIRNRKGSTLFAEGMGTSPVDTVSEWVGGTGTAKLLAASNLNIYDCTSGTPSSLGSGFSNNQWQTTLFRDSGSTTRLVMVNGADTPQSYNGTTLAPIAFTGIATPSNLISVSQYRNRIYLVEKDTTKVWYGNTVDAAAGALVAFDVGSLFQQGGYLMACIPSTRDGDAQGTAEQLLFISSQGDVLVYQGTFPGDASWSIVARYQIPPPMGRRCFSYLGADLLLLTSQGVIPYSALLSGGAQKYAQLSDKIQSALVKATTDYRQNFGWQILPYQRQNLLYLNIPVATGTQSQQAVLNTLTGAWCQFTGVNACSWCLFNGVPYFGGASGRVWRFDNGYTDGGVSIVYDGKTAFNYFNDRQRLKRFTLARPLIRSTQAFTLGFNVDVDFNNRALASGALISGGSDSPWDTSPWDTSPWDGEAISNNEMYSVDGLGRCAAMRLLGSYTELEFEITAFHLNYEPGGIL
jgi:hypothetical protein